MGHKPLKRLYKFSEDVHLRGMIFVILILFVVWTTSEHSLVRVWSHNAWEFIIGANKPIEHIEYHPPKR